MERTLSGDPIKLANLQGFNLGSGKVMPSARHIQGPMGRAVMEPRMMQVLVLLATQPDQLVTRDMFLARCWNGVPVGDDSLNRAIAGVRRALRESVGDTVSVETVPASGYMLRTTDDAASTAAIKAGWRSWKLGLPDVDHSTLNLLRKAAGISPDRADVHGMLALILRNAAEYADLELCHDLVMECEAAALKALALDPGERQARMALIGIAPLFGDWTPRREKLLAMLEEIPDNLVAIHDLCMLEMATGRARAAAALSGRLIAHAPLAATFHYKRTYQLWATGDVPEMDRVADRAMQLWPGHSANWFARFWSLAFTDRPRQAMQQLNDALRPNIPSSALAALEQTLLSIMDPADAAARELAIRSNLAAAERGPAQSLAAIIHLSGLGETAAAFQVAGRILSATRRNQRWLA